MYKSKNVSIEEFLIARRKVESCFIEAVTPATQEQFCEALGDVPPVGWIRAEDSESFKVGEPIYGDIHRIFARVGDQYFVLANRVSMSHACILQAIVDYLEQAMVAA